MRKARRIFWKVWSNVGPDLWPQAVLLAQQVRRMRFFVPLWFSDAV